MQNPLAPKKKTVDGIMSVFTKTISDLEQVSEDNEAAVVELKAEKVEIDRQIESASVEATLARQIRSSLRDLIEG